MCLSDYVPVAHSELPVKSFYDFLPAHIANNIPFLSASCTT